MIRLAMVLLAIAVCFFGISAKAELPFETVFKGRSQFDYLVGLAQKGNWKALPIGDRTATVGKSLVETPYKGFTLEIDDHIEAASVNLLGLDCWTFFEVSLAFARMLDLPADQWNPQSMLHFIELDRYRSGKCTGSYLSRLHYLEEWLADNQRRGLIQDLTRTLGGVRANHKAGEMTAGWRGYRYMRENPSIRAAIAAMEDRVSVMPMYQIPKSRVAAIEPKLQNGDILCIVSHDGSGVATSHVGLAYRDSSGVLRFMHASSPRNYGKVVIDQSISKYLHEFSSHTGIMVGRPLR